ncbi:GDP-mannose 4,6-dehydratase [Solirubrobacter sp. CPCC 204708]|uniref:GDP-mannose 4,6-dehydratase n=1 Tax=Solirubrobacter deserti TaxID=2282478 RepID=A0ABT4RND1_9ACTN|nr:GDP-mannose 4,6-dehydratase [Solirubrobacter deserti]MBE2318407.1 GDP-mannose 4,6-dehydratase [Solirubrobacter deserti]MDA0140074.1 GDP-mannose 4,6-dehydratase [Solirubrobacter deserti]
MSRVFITGASGFAGAYLVAACEAAGDTVLPAPRSAQANLADPAVARRLVAEARPDVVYHLAARAHVGESWADPLGTLADNVAITANLMEAVRHEAPEAVVVSVGSGEEYGPPETVPTTEDAPLRPQNPYAVSKASSGLVARFYADAHGLRVIHARAFNHSGPGQKTLYAIANFAMQIAKGLDAGEPSITVGTGNLDTRRDYTDVRDIVRAYRLLAERGEPGVFNVCSGVSRSARELIAALSEIAGVPVAPEVDPAKLRAHEVMEIRGSHERLRAATGWAPEIPLEQTLRDTLASFRA